MTLQLEKKGIDAMASLAAEVNQGVENIGARRLHTVMERLLEEIGFTATDKPGATVIVDAAFVEKNIGDLDRPPWKWSDLMYVFGIEEDHHAEEAIQGRGGRHEAAPG